jgi:glycosyltransferase involved in cell wall biosynthesis
MPRILFCIDSLRVGGKERRLLALIKQLLDSSDYEMELIIFNKKNLHYKEVFEWNIKNHFVEHQKLGKFGALKKVYSIISDFNPHIVHSWDTISTLASIPAVKLLKIKLITSKITDAPPSYKSLSYFGILSEICFYFADLILANSQAGIDAYRVSSKKSRVIYNGFDFRRILQLNPKEELKKKYEINQNFLVGMVASFTSRKDFETFLQAAHIVRKKNSHIGFICTGDGVLREGLENKFSSEGIYFTGRLNDVESIMNLCDVGVLMSNNSTHGEGISNSLMEFMAQAKPVIASDNGGNTELIEHGTSGTILSENDPELWANTIIHHYENSEHYQQIGKNSRKRVKEVFSIDAMVAAFKNVYSESLN